MGSMLNKDMTLVDACIWGDINQVKRIIKKIWIKHNRYINNRKKYSIQSQCNCEGTITNTKLDLSLDSRFFPDNSFDALWWACYYGNKRVVKLLLDYHIEYNINYDIHKYGPELFFLVCKYDGDTIMEYLLEYCEKYTFHMIDDELIFKALQNGLEKILIILLNYRLRIGIPFDIEINENNIYRIEHKHKNINIHTPTFKILFEYGEKMNYKLNIYKLSYPSHSTYLKYLSKHNYIDFNIDKYNITDGCNKYNHIITNYYHICTILCTRKKIKMYSDNFHVCAHIYNNNYIDFTYNKKLYNTNYILFYWTNI